MNHHPGICDSFHLPVYLEESKESPTSHEKENNNAKTPDFPHAFYADEEKNPG
jgi:hypothetical protein